MEKNQSQIQRTAALGMPGNEAWMYANTRKGCCVTGKWLGRWITNNLLRKKGLISAKDHYQKKHQTIQLQFAGL